MLASALLVAGHAAGCNRGGQEAPAAPGAAETWVCPMHPEVVETADVPCRICGMRLDRRGGGAFLCPEHAARGSAGTVDVVPGKCALCAADLFPAAMAVVFDCPAHGRLALPEPGACPLCGKDLLPRTAAVLWTCAEHAGEASVQERNCGRCGRPLGRTLAELPHGDHIPKHGGVFFMAADRWHHLEGTLPGAGRFRLHLYDNFTRPLAAGKVTGYLRRARALPGGDVELDPASIPLETRSGAEDVLEAVIPDFALPLEVTVFLHFPKGAAGTEPERFDFRFLELTVDPAGAPPPAAERGGLRPFEVPADRGAALAALRDRASRVEEILARGALAEVYLPALEAKDIALALEARLADLPPARRAALERAAAGVVRGAWLLDEHGDLGDREKTSASHKVFAAAVADLLAAVGE